MSRINSQLTQIAANLAAAGNREITMNAQNRMVAVDNSFNGRLVRWVTSFFSDTEKTRNKACFDFIKGNVDTHLGADYTTLFKLRMQNNVEYGKPISARKVSIVLDELINLKAENEALKASNASNLNQDMIDFCFEKFPNNCPNFLSALEQSGLTLADVSEDNINSIKAFLLEGADEHYTHNLEVASEDFIKNKMDNVLNSLPAEIKQRKNKEAILEAKPQLTELINKTIENQGIKCEVTDTFVNNLIKKILQKNSQASSVLSKQAIDDLFNAEVGKCSDILARINQSMLSDKAKQALTKSVLSSLIPTQNMLDVAIKCLSEENIKTLNGLFFDEDNQARVTIREAIEKTNAIILDARNDFEKIGVEYGQEEIMTSSLLVAHTVKNYSEEARANEPLKTSLAYNTLYDLQLVFGQEEKKAKDSGTAENHIEIFISTQSVVLARMLIEAYTNSELEVYLRSHATIADLLTPEDRAAIEKKYMV